MGAFSAAITANGDSVFVAFKGTLDENSNFNGTTLTQYKYITLDLAEIERVTSKGIRAWILWLTRLDHTKTYYIKKCSRIFVAQANLITGLIPQWMHVKSLELPYYCEHCGKSFGKMMELTKVGPPDEVELTTKCPGCGEEAEFDALPERYFQFLERQSAGK